jgi:hypothetical protein
VKETASTLVGIGAVAATGGTNQQMATGGNIALAADQYNRQLHPNERARARQLAAASGGKYTVAQIENAMRNSGNTATNESVTTGMVVNTSDQNGVYDSGAVFNAGASGTGTIVQQLPNGGKVDPALAAYIVANTGGGTSPYGWSDVQTGNVTPPTYPNAGLNTIKPNANGCVTSNCSAGLTPGPSENRTQAQIDASLDRTVVGIALTPTVAVAAVVTAPLTTTLVGSAAVGGGISGGSNVAVQVITTGKVDIEEAAIATTVGATFGVAGYGLTVATKGAANGAATIVAADVNAATGAGRVPVATTATSEGATAATSTNFGSGPSGYSSISTSLEGKTITGQVPNTSPIALSNSGTNVGNTTVQTPTQLAINNATGKAAELQVINDIRGQGFSVQPQTSLTSGSVRCVADCSIYNGAPGATVRIPPGFVAEDLNGALLLDATGKPITSFNLNSSGQAVVEVKTGMSPLTPNQVTVYPTVQNGTAVPVGGNAVKAFGTPLPSPLPPTPVIVLRKP